MLRALAKGFNPETGELLNHTSLVHSPEVIRILFRLAEELQVHPERPKKGKLTPEERRQKNITEGKPANSYFPWTEEEKGLLTEGYSDGKTVVILSVEFERSLRGIAVQLEKMEWGCLPRCRRIVHEPLCRSIQIVCHCWRYRV